MIVNSITADTTQVIAMLNAKYGENMKTVPKKTQLSPGEVVSVLHYYWSPTKLSVHYGPPPDMPTGSFRIIEIFGTKLAEENAQMR
ncbi:hypothetical protein [Cyanobium gracile]|uniref:hypothetical protein n=1 Tax=Cyanobium gracile TaxID=59930 RepID=UPI00155AB455|nr:hypothetical protein [Cyanobium gracile]